MDRHQQHRIHQNKWRNFLQITKIEQFEKDKAKIYLDDVYVFWIFQKQVNTYHLVNGQELPQELYQEFFNMAVTNAKQKALYILERMDRTQQELLQKLEKVGFTKEICELALSFVKQFHYIDDHRYAVTYLRTHATSKSKRNLMEVLKSKGIDSETAESAYEEVETELEVSLERTAIRKELERFQRKTTKDPLEEKKKWIASLVRKGFSYHLIRKEIDILEEIED